MPNNEFLPSQNGQEPAFPKAVYSEISAGELQHRAAAIQSMAVLDTPPEEGFDALARLAASVCGAPIAVVSLIDHDRVWFKAAHGLEIKHCAHQHSFCCETANSKRLLEVVNAASDPRFSQNPFVKGDPGVFYYAGAPIMYQGIGIGTVCVLDYKPRELPAKSLQALTEMASIATAMLRARIEAFNLLSTLR